MSGSQKDQNLHEIPLDMREAINTGLMLSEKWDALTPLAKNEWICWVITCKKPETRAQHIIRMKQELLDGKRRPCCWPGCPHRRPDAAKWFSKGALKAAKEQIDNG
jgi:hypothetical protein